MKKLLIISNDKLYFKKKKIYSDYNDTINIIEGLAKKNILYFISRSSYKRGIYVAKIKKIFQLKIQELRSFDFQKKKILMISITPFNFFVFLLISFFHKRIDGFVLLRSDGFKEYNKKYGILGKKLYELFFNAILKKFYPIIVSKSLTGIESFNYHNILPSEINEIWKKNIKKPNLSIANLLYLGRIKKEKGIFSLLKLTKSLTIKYKLNIVGANKTQSYKGFKIKYYKETSNINKIIQYYDQNNIFVLPSYTEGSPKVILESLSRFRPVIIFTEIKHVKSKWKGVFVSKRNSNNFQKTINHILKNYKKIQIEMKKNKIPTKNQFQKRLVDIIK